MTLDMPPELRAFLQCLPEGGFYVDIKTTPEAALKALRKLDAECRNITGEAFCEFRE